MLNYYKRNHPKEPYTEGTSPVVKVKTSVLKFHDLNDSALLPGILNNTWDNMEKDFTLVTIPGASHFVQQDASDLISRSIKMWLNR
jgi:epoxide hydrolase 4